MDNQDRDWRDISEDEILQANIAKYSQPHIIQFYQDFEEPQYSYREYDVLFGAVIQEIVAGRGECFKAVDLCGGAGKGAFVIKHLAPRSQVSLVDLAEPMLDIAQQRMRAEQIDDLRLVAEDAFTFLQREEKFDLIVLSSAIHHFKDPAALLEACSQRLEPGGFIITIADPSVLIKSRRYRLMEFMLVDAAARRQKLKQWLSRQPDADYDIAEYQTITGIDDRALMRELPQRGLTPLLHIRYPAGGGAITRRMIRLRLFWAFAGVLRRQADSNGQEAAMRQRWHRALAADMPFPYKVLKTI